MNSPSQAGSGFCQYRRVICALLFFATTINYINRQIRSLLKPVLKGQFRCVDTRFSGANPASQNFRVL